MSVRRRRRRRRKVGSSWRVILAQHVVEPPTRSTVMAAEGAVEMVGRGRWGGVPDVLVLSMAFGKLTDLVGELEDERARCK